MDVRELMWTHVHTAEPPSLASHAGIRMTVGQLSGLAVVEAEKVIVGMVTEFDLIRALRAGKDLEATVVDDLMTRKAITVDAPVDEIMERERIIRVPAVSGGKLVGIVSRNDVLQAALIDVYARKPAA